MGCSCFTWSTSMSALRRGKYGLVRGSDEVGAHGLTGLGLGGLGLGGLGFGGLGFGGLGFGGLGLGGLGVTARLDLRRMHRHARAHLVEPLDDQAIAGAKTAGHQPAIADRAIRDQRAR